MPMNAASLGPAITALVRDRPELFGRQTTGNLESANFERRFGQGGPSALERGRAGGGFEAQNDLQELEVFGINEQQDAMRGRFQERVLSATANRAGAEKRAAEARARAASGADVDAGTFERRTRGRGLTARQQKSAARQLGLSRAIAQADAGSSSRRATTEQAIGARKAGETLEAGVFSQEQAGITALANAEGQRRVRAEQDRAAKANEKNSMIGTAIGIGTSLLMLSSESAKDKRGKATNVLDRLRNVRVDRWNYKGEDREHIGPYAEEFNDTFGTGKEHRGMISLVDAVGVALGAIKELDERTA